MAAGVKSFRTDQREFLAKLRQIRPFLLRQQHLVIPVHKLLKESIGLLW